MFEMASVRYYLVAGFVALQAVKSMGTDTEPFNLDATLAAIGHAFYGVTCNIMFWAAVHGLAIALTVGVLGFFLYHMRFKLGKPFMIVCRRLCLVCSIIAIPGLITLATVHSLPSAGVANINSIAFIVFWSMVCVHLSAEEMNTRWFKI
jgi:hypothetical protein